MGGEDYHLVEKRASLCWIFVGSLFGVCLFLGVPDSSDSCQNKKKEKGARQKKKMEGTNEPDPLNLGAPLYRYTSQVGPRFGDSRSLVSVKMVPLRHS